MKFPAIGYSFAIVVLATSLVTISSTPAHAGLIGTSEILAEQAQQNDRDKVQAFLERAEVKAQLQAMDVPAAMAQERALALTRAEAASLAQRIDSLPAAGALSGNDFIVILLVAILVALIL